MNITFFDAMFALTHAEKRGHITEDQVKGFRFEPTGRPPFLAAWFCIGRRHTYGIICLN